MHELFTAIADVLLYVPALIWTGIYSAFGFLGGALADIATFLFHL